MMIQRQVQALNLRGQAAHSLMPIKHHSYYLLRPLASEMIQEEGLGYWLCREIRKVHLEQLWINLLMNWWLDQNQANFLSDSVAVFALRVNDALNASPLLAVLRNLSLTS